MEELIERIAIDESRIVVTPSRALRTYMSEPFEVRYDPAIDLATMPVQISLLPFLWNVAPIVWATGLELVVDVLDRRVAEAFDAVRDELRQMYPSLRWHGSIGARSLVETPSRPASQYTKAALFSGGVDSTWTALRHSDKSLLLISVWGTHVPLSDRDAWAKVQARNESFAADHAGGLAVISGNVKALNDLRLRGLSTEIPNWWQFVQHGMAYTGLTAPLLHHHGIPILHIASTYTEASATNWGSLPRLDDRVSLGTASVSHDSFELSRQDKVSRIVSFHEQSDIDPPQLRVCLDEVRSKGLNCERCQKCVRTALGVVVAGGDPRRYGFPRYGPSLHDEVPKRFAEFRYHFTGVQVFLWNDLNRHLAKRPDLDGPFWSWLRSMDFEAYRLSQPTPRVLSEQRKAAIGARLPGLYGLARGVKMAKRRVVARD